MEVARLLFRRIGLRKERGKEEKREGERSNPACAASSSRISIALQKGSVWLKTFSEAKSG